MRGVKNEIEKHLNGRWRIEQISSQVASVSTKPDSSQTCESATVVWGLFECKFVEYQITLLDFINAS